MAENDLPTPTQEEADTMSLQSSGVLGPVCNDVPVVTGTGTVGDVLSCTMGNWANEPDSYAYQWQADGAPVGTDASDYTAAPEDVGKSVCCVVTASNASGSTMAPASNGITIAAAATATSSRSSRSSS